MSLTEKKNPFRLKPHFNPNIEKNKGSTTKRIILRYVPSDTGEDYDDQNYLQSYFHKHQQETDNDKIASSLFNTSKIKEDDAQKDFKQRLLSKQRKKVRFSDDIRYISTTNQKKQNRTGRSERLLCIHRHGNRSPSFNNSTNAIINLKNCIFALVNCFLFSLLIRTCMKVFLTS